VAGPLNTRRATIGQLRDRVEVQAKVAGVLNEFREPVTNWQTTSTEWAAVDLTAGDEFPRSGGQQASLSGTVTMRSIPGLDPTKRLVWLRAGGGRTVLNIVSCPPHEGGANFVVVTVKAEHKPGAA
jgi:head-tail adaptor